MGLMSTMGTEGDIELKWDKNVDAEVDHAEETFKSCKKQGMIAYKVKGKKRNVINAFDADAEHIVFTPARSGG